MQLLGREKVVERVSFSGTSGTFHDLQTPF